MTVLNLMYKLKFFRGIFRSDMEVDRVIQEHKQIRESLNHRLEKVTRATLNGETEWFLQLVKKDPDCVMEIIKECDLKK